eukprot:3483513-Rhodomonas_salina.2
MCLVAGQPSSVAGAAQHRAARSEEVIPVTTATKRPSRRNVQRQEMRKKKVHSAGSTPVRTEINLSSEASHRKRIGQHLARSGLSCGSHRRIRPARRSGSTIRDISTGNRTTHADRQRSSPERSRG